MADGPRFLDPHAVLSAAAERLVPAVDGHPGAVALGGVDYVDALLSAFLVDPPRLFAGGPFSGRHGGDGSFDRFLRPSRLETLAWRARIEGSRGEPLLERNGPVRGWQAEYREGIARLGDDFAEVSPEERDRRLAAVGTFRALLYEHLCEGCYGDPVYGGNTDGAGWRAIGFPGDALPRGYTDDKVSGRA